MHQFSEINIAKDTSSALLVDHQVRLHTDETCLVADARGFCRTAELQGKRQALAAPTKA
jgi:hypothetical protein